MLITVIFERPLNTPQEEIFFFLHHCFKNKDQVLSHQNIFYFTRTLFQNVEKVIIRLLLQPH